MINLIIGIILVLIGAIGILINFDYFLIIIGICLLAFITLLGIIMIISSIIIIIDDKKATLEEERYKDNTKHENKQ